MSAPHDRFVAKVRELALMVDLSRPTDAARFKRDVQTLLTEALLRLDADLEDEARGEAHDAEQREEGWFV